MTDNPPLILLAEDEPNIAFSLSYLLQRSGFVVESTTDGAQVEGKAHATCPDAIILDIMLPNKSGFEILQGLREGKSTRSIPILILSARGQTADVERAMRLGADDYLTKPFANAEVIARVKKLLER